jgi:glycosyltransferase involved in cell wall biosynthesis
MSGTDTPRRTTDDTATRRTLRIAFANWRDLDHPEGGGSERYVQRVAAGLVERGHHVALVCARHALAPADETRDGVRIRRRGGRLGVYPAAVRSLRELERETRAPFDVVVDVQNGIPFASTMSRRTPVVNLVHHVHREQWPVVFSPAVARVGWLVESRVAPRVYRGRQYVAVSEQTRSELAELGVRAGDVTVIHNGTDAPPALGVPRSEHPLIVVLGRLVPHKRVEHAIDVLAALLPQHPGLRLAVVGEGWWHQQIREHAEGRGVTDHVDMLGFVSEREKHAALARAWVKLAPSVKEGWGLCVVEAGSHGVPTVAYTGAGGLSESIVDGSTGCLVHDLDDMVRTTSRLLDDHAERARLGEAARQWSRTFTWPQTVAAWERLLRHTAAGGRPVERHDLDLESVESGLTHQPTQARQPTVAQRSTTQIDLRAGESGGIDLRGTGEVLRG